MEKPIRQDCEDDASALLALLTTGLARERTSSGVLGDPLMYRGRISLNVESPFALHVVIQKTRVRLRDWMSRPWYAKKVAAYQKRGGLPQRASDCERSSLDELRSVFRAAMMLRYGVAVDYSTFRALRRLVVDGELSELELRKFLHFPTVWWGTAVRPSPHEGSIQRVLKRIWAMGRPAQGRLMLIRFHWATRLMLGLLSSATLAMVAFLIFAAVVCYVFYGPVQIVAFFLWATSQFAVLSAGLLWFGLYGDRAARFLSERLPHC